MVIPKSMLLITCLKLILFQTIISTEKYVKASLLITTLCRMSNKQRFKINVHVFIQNCNDFNILNINLT